MFYFIISNSPAPHSNTVPSQAPNNSDNTIQTDQQLVNDFDVLEGNEEPIGTEGLIRTESLSDGTEKKYFLSSVPGRERIITTKGKDNIIFESIPIGADFSVNLNDFTQVYGDARFVFLGSSFYGGSAETHIYADEGIAIIVNPATGQVYEQHVFIPVRTEDYVRLFGEDISSSSGP